MKLSKIAVAAATTAALTFGTLAAPAAQAAPLPPGGSATWLLQANYGSSFGLLDKLRGDRHPSETFMVDMLLLAPLALLLYPLQMSSEAELRLSSYPRM